jgi:hypothetical protein
MMLCLVVVVQRVVDDAFEGQMHDEYYSFPFQQPI